MRVPVKLPEVYSTTTRRTVSLQNDSGPLNYWNPAPVA